MSPAPSISVAQARQWLGRHFERDVAAVELVGEGSWSRCFGFVLDGRALVVRFGAHVDDFEKDRLAASFARPGLPVPDVLHIGSAPAGAAISERGFGEPLESLGESGWQAVLPSLLTLLDAARSVDLSATSGSGQWDGDGIGPHPTWRDHLVSVGDDVAGSRVHGRLALLATSEVGDRTFRAGLARLGELVDAGPTERHLVHADLLNRNVLVEGGRITCVFDWGCALYGDHLYDLATLIFWSAWYPDLAAIDVRAAAVEHFAAIGLAVDDMEERLLACQLHVALGGVAYSAFVGDPSLAWINDHLAALL